METDLDMNELKHIYWITKVTPQQREIIEKFFQLFNIEYEVKET